MLGLKLVPAGSDKLAVVWRLDQLFRRRRSHAGAVLGLFKSAAPFSSSNNFEPLFRSTYNPFVAVDLQRFRTYSIVRRFASFFHTVVGCLKVGV